MSTLRFLLTIVLLACATQVHAQTPAVRVLFYTGNVTVTGHGKPTIGQQLASRDALVLAGGATLQLSINGKVLKYSQPATVRVSDAIKRAGKGENTAVATTMRTLAQASSSSSSRTSQAGATRVEGGRADAVDSAATVVVTDGRHRADSEIDRYTGIDQGMGKIEKLGEKFGNQNDLLVALEPRATAVPAGPIRFRWLRTKGISTYVVSVKDHLGNQIWHLETADTSVSWDGRGLVPEALYEWTLSDSRDQRAGVTSVFHRLAELDEARLQQGASAITRELGSNNPALPLVLGAFYADNGCHGEAAHQYTCGATASPEHYGEFMRRAVDEYADAIRLRDEELKLIYDPNR